MRSGSHALRQKVCFCDKQFFSSFFFFPPLFLVDYKLKRQELRKGMAYWFFSVSIDKDLWPEQVF